MPDISQLNINGTVYDIKDAVARAGGGSSSDAALVSESYTFPISYSAGTIGTRGYQGSETITKAGYTPISVLITYVGASNSYIPVAFLGANSTDTLLYCNAYRCTTSAVNNSSITVKVVYAKNGAGATTLEAWDGSVSA